MAITSAQIQDQNRSEVPVQTVTNTPWGNLIQKCCNTKQTLNLPQYTTLNERHNVLADESIGQQSGANFELKYFSIGIGGSVADGTTSLGTTRLRVCQHQPTDMNLFAPIPFLVRPLDADLTTLEREQFRMRTVETLLDDQQYAVYWVMLVNFEQYFPVVNKITRDANGNEDAKPYVPVKDSLFNPQPLPFTSVGTVPVSDTYTNNSGILDCSLNGRMLNEIANACKLMFGDASYASVNEVMLLQGIDTQHDGLISGGATIRYTEVQSAVAAHFVTERDGRNALNNVKIQMAYDHGASEPMLLHTNSSTTTTQQGS